MNHTKIKTQSKWKMLIFYINSKKIGSNLTRKELMCQFGIKRSTSIDSYRRLLTVIGVLERTKQGVYTVKNHLNHNKFSYNDVKKFAYDPTEKWKQWFMVTELFLNKPNL